MLSYRKIVQKVVFCNFCPKNGTKNTSFGGYFLSKQEVTSCLTWFAFAALKTTSDEYLNTPIHWKMPSKRWIFHWKKCPIFVDSVFKKIRARPAERAFLASVPGLRWQLWEPATKSLCGGSPFFEAQNSYEKSTSGPGGSKKGQIQIFFLLDFVKLLGPLQAT